MHDSSKISTPVPEKQVNAQDVERRRRFLLLSEQDEKKLAAVKDAVAAASNTVVARFYDHLTGSEDTRVKFQSEKHTRPAPRKG